MREYRLIRSKRRTLALQIKDGELTVRAPEGLEKSRIDDFVRRKEPWIRTHIAIQEERSRLHPEPDEAQRQRLRSMAEEILPQRVEHFGKITGLRPKQIRINQAKTRFGSCSSKGNICFSWRLMEYPPEAIDYVVLHELCHLRFMDHSANFYALVEQYMPDWKRRREMLKK